MQKNQLIILIVIVVVVLGGLIIWGITKTGPAPNPGPVAGEEEEEEEVSEVFSMTAVISSVNAEEKYLMVSPVDEEKQIKVVVSDATELIKVEFTFDPSDTSKEATMTPTQTAIEISGFAVGDHVFIKSKDNIANKTEIGNIEFIHILP